MQLKIFRLDGKKVLVNMIVVNLKSNIMKNSKKYNVIELTPIEIKSIRGGGFFRSLGRAISDYFDGFRCGCGDANPDYSQLQGPKW